MLGQNRMTRRMTAVLLGMVAWMLGAATAFSQGYPDHQVRLVVPYPPGGPNDLLGRLLAADLTEHWKQSVIVDNKPGGNGVIGSQFVARAAPDGYTLLTVTPSSTTINVSLMPNLAFDPVKELAPISTLANGMLILVVKPSLPVQNVKDLIALAKKQPGRLTFGSAGIGSGGHLSGDLFKSMAGVDMTHVGYKGGAPAIADLMGGQIDMMFADISVATPLVKSGKVRALAVTGGTRSHAFPDLPTIAESGVPGYRVLLWFGVAAPAGTPAPVIATLNAQIQRLVATPAYRERLLSLGWKRRATRRKPSRC
jgi:tripartite-type tricarboxylate transporter receptor subunit TctC